MSDYTDEEVAAMQQLIDNPPAPTPDLRKLFTPVPLTATEKIVETNPLHVTTDEHATPHAAQLRSIAQAMEARWSTDPSEPNRVMAKELREAATAYEQLDGQLIAANKHVEIVNESNHELGMELTAARADLARVQDRNKVLEHTLKTHYNWAGHAEAAKDWRAYAATLGITGCRHGVPYEQHCSDCSREPKP